MTKTARSLLKIAVLATVTAVAVNVAAATPSFAQTSHARTVACETLPC